MLLARCSLPYWRIVFCTFRQCMSFYTARVIHVESTRSRSIRHVRFTSNSVRTRRAETARSGNCGREQMRQFVKPDLFDHLVGAQQDRCGHVDAHGPGRPEIDDRRELTRALDWKVRWLRTPENLVDEDRGPPIHLW